METQGLHQPKRSTKQRLAKPSPATYAIAAELKAGDRVIQFSMPKLYVS